MPSTNSHLNDNMEPDDRFWRAEDMLCVLSTHWSTGLNKKGSSGELIDRYFNSLEEHATENLSMRGMRLDNLESIPESDEELPLDKVPNHEFIRRIGSGGFGEVWLTRQVVTEHYRACKLISASHAVELGGLKWLKQRASSHPNLFPIEEVGMADGWIYCLMPLAENANPQTSADWILEYESMTLQRLLHRQWRLPNDECVAIGGEIANGLICLHERGLTHGDIKPSNMLRIDGRWAISDYGLLTASANDIAQGHTPSYTPPEGPGTQAADMYALGVVFMMMITGYGSRSLDEFKNCSRSDLIRDGINPKWKQVINLLTDQSPNQRPKAHEVGELLDQLGPEGRSRSHRKRVKLGALSALGLILATGTIFIADGYIESFQQGMFTEADKWLFKDRFRDVTVAVDLFKKMPVVLNPKISSSDFYSLAITENGEVVAWGSNKFGTLDVPHQIVDPVRVSAGPFMAMVLQANGQVITWGSKRVVESTRMPDSCPPAIDIAALMSDNALILLPDGTVRGWGAGFERINNQGPSRELEIPDDLQDVTRISGGNAHWIAQLRNGDIRGFGNNFSNQLSFPQSNMQVIDFEASESWSLLLYENGKMESFGLGSGDTLSAPGTSNAIDIAVGTYCGIALDAGAAQQTVQFWGRIGGHKFPPNIHLGDVVSVFAGGNQVGVVHSDGRVTMWGDNNNGQCEPPPDLRIRLTDPDLDRNGKPDWVDKLQREYADSDTRDLPIQSELSP